MAARFAPRSLLSEVCFPYAGIRERLRCISREPRNTPDNGQFQARYEVKALLG
jgi:hypothetical protein